MDKSESGTLDQESIHSQSPLGGEYKAHASFDKKEIKENIIVQSS